MKIYENFEVVKLNDNMYVIPVTGEILPGADELEYIAEKDANNTWHIVECYSNEIEDNLTFEEMLNKMNAHVEELKDIYE